MSATEAPTSRRPGARIARRIAVGATACALCLIGGAPAIAAAAPADPRVVTSAAEAPWRASIVGDWVGTVYRSDGVTEPGVRFSFAADGTVVQVGPAGTGTGTWSALGRNAFSFQTRTDTVFGYLLVTQRVRVFGDRFAASGEGAGYDADGNLIQGAHSDILAARDGAGG